MNQKYNIDLGWWAYMYVHVYYGGRKEAYNQKFTI